MVAITVANGYFTGSNNSIQVSESLQISGTTTIENGEGRSISVNGCAELSGTLFLKNVNKSQILSGSYDLMYVKCKTGGFSKITIANDSATFCLNEKKRTLYEFNSFCISPFQVF